jgi:peptide/nickel transport system substrate-binding protein
MLPAVSIVGVPHPAMVRRFAPLALVFALIVTGCSDGYRDLPQAQAAQVGTTSDINPRDPSTLRDGGNLRFPLTSFPENFNEMNIDGNTADTGSVVSPTLPGAFITRADGTFKLNTDYFTGAELTGTNPQVVTYTINPKATWNHLGRPQGGGRRVQRPRQTVFDRQQSRVRTGQVGDQGR